jgi:hypothetical protein
MARAKRVTTKRNLHKHANVQNAKSHLLLMTVNVIIVPLHATWRFKRNVMCQQKNADALCVARYLNHRIGQNDIAQQHVELLQGVFDETCTLS